MLYGIASAQPTVRSIAFEGNSYFSDRQLIEQARITMPMPSSGLTAMSDAVTALYRAEGYYSFTVDSIVGLRTSENGEQDLTIFVTENVRTLIAEVVISGTSVLPNTRLLERMETATGEPFRPELLESDIRTILEMYADAGHPFAAVSAESIGTVQDDPAALKVHLIVTEGPAVTIDEVTVEGNTVTRPEVIIREARLIPGGAFDQTRLELIRRRIERLQLFSMVGEPELYIRTGSAGSTLSGGLRIPVTEGSANNFDGILGYVPPTGTGTEGYITGNLHLTMRNLFGTGRKAMFRWQRETALTQELELQYREPWMFGIPLAVQAAFQQRKQDSSYVRTKSDLRTDLAVTDALTIAVHASWESVYPSSELQRFTVFRSEALFFGADMLYDTRVNLRNPTGGLRYSAAVQQGEKRILGPEQYLGLTVLRNFTLRRFSMDAEVFLSTLSRQVLMFGVH
ncbi:MAG: BamA/TamA family outer membrane protein, partial [Bacteroidetes bacterium]|nr:BamA/TamA family outer membrane protein [Bacteroidota bacterium]